MKTTLLPLLVLLTAGGCASVQHIRNAEDAGSAYAEINQRAERTNAQVTLTSGQTNRAHRLRVAPDSSAWLDGPSGQQLRFATTDIQQVQFRDQFSGTLKGFGIGALAGAAFMVGTWQVDGYDWDVSLIMGALAAPVTGLIGALIGSLTGSRKVYRFSASQPEPGQ
jgi:uncharacterized protein YceK